MIKNNKTQKESCYQYYLEGVNFCVKNFKHKHIRQGDLCIAA